MTRPVVWKPEGTVAAAALANAIVEHLPDALLILDANGQIQFANAAADRLFEQPAGGLPGSTFGYPIVDEGFAEIEIMRPGRTPLLVEIRTAEINWGDQTGRLVALRDVTDRKAMEERLRDLERDRTDAEAANRVRADFLAVMSHELRTPLNAIVGYTDLLDLGVDGELSAQQHERLDRLRQSARHLLGLVNDVLDLAKLDAGRLSVKSSIGMLSVAAQQAVELIQPTAEARSQTVSLRCADAHAMFLGDDSRVRQILVNLLQNATKFTPRGGSIDVRCGLANAAAPEARLSRGPRYVFVEVSDSGIGIPPDRLAAVFDPFVRVETGHARKTEGSGLGLSISRRLARLMNGDLTLTSELDRGSVFTLWLPAVIDPASASPTVPKGDQPTTPHWAEAAEDPAMADVGEIILRETVAIVGSLVARLRHERDLPGIENLRYTELANHFASFLAVLGETVVGLAESSAVSSGAIDEGLEVLRLLADRHGRQRARIGWGVPAIQREWQVMSDEIARALRAGGAHLSRPAIDEAERFIQRQLVDAEARSTQALRAARANGKHSVNTD